MTPLFKNIIPVYQRIALNRLKRIDEVGSPVYPFNVPVIAAATYIEQDIASQFPAARKYQPLDWTEIINNDTVDLNLYLNGTGGDYYHIPAGTTRIINRTAVWQYRLTNCDAVTDTTLGKVKISFQRLSLDADEQARRML